MTTRHTPLHILRNQADRIATTLKNVEAGHAIDLKLNALRIEKDTFEVGIAMDDKIIKLHIPWTTIKEASHTALSDYILEQMLEGPGDKKGRMN